MKKNARRERQAEHKRLETAKKSVPYTPAPPSIPMQTSARSQVYSWWDNLSPLQKMAMITIALGTSTVLAMCLYAQLNESVPTENPVTTPSKDKIATKTQKHEFILPIETNRPPIKAEQRSGFFQPPAVEKSITEREPSKTAPKSPSQNLLTEERIRAKISFRIPVEKEQDIAFRIAGTEEWMQASQPKKREWRTPSFSQ